MITNLNIVMISNVINFTSDYFLTVRIVKMCLVTEMSKSQESHSFEMVLMDVEIIINLLFLVFLY